jgi:hypothetical protein
VAAAAAAGPVAGGDAHAAEEEETRRFMESSGIRLCKKCGAGVMKTHGCDKV